MSDLISRQDAIKELESGKDKKAKGEIGGFYNQNKERIIEHFVRLPSAQPEDWMERNKERILQAGMEGREIEFRIGGRLFAIREKAQ